MKLRLIVVFAMILCSLQLYAQSDSTSIEESKKTWDMGGKISLTMSQTSYSNWASGGQNSISGVLAGSVRLKHEAKKLSWENTLELAYGTLYQFEESDRRKTDDKIDFATKLGYAASKSWNYTILAQLKTQFDRGYKSYPIEDKSKYTSMFMSPAYLTFSIGMDYKPNKDLSVYISPLSLRNTIVLDDTLSHKGAFGVTPDSHMLSEYGAMIKATYGKTFFEKIQLKSKVELFSNLEYDPQNINVNVEVDIGIKTTSWLTTRLYTQLLYDDNVKVSEDEGPALQVKEVLGIGLSYSF
ncbi:MAG: DUF3078 domain-containing protein [Prevotellaceae bacterium]|jgi:hypothetical protein|nr:DUF3078 domain-containing protein [Prevotellaceae bacterium]